jgi:hypothetical protein
MYQFIRTKQKHVTTVSKKQINKEEILKYVLAFSYNV